MPKKSRPNIGRFKKRIRKPKQSESAPSQVTPIHVLDEDLVPFDLNSRNTENDSSAHMYINSPDCENLEPYVADQGDDRTQTQCDVLIGNTTHHPSDLIEDLLQSNSVLEPYQRLKSSIKTIQPSIESYGYTVANTVMTIQVVKVIDSLNSGIEHGFVIDKDLNIHYIANHKKVPASDFLPNKVNSLLDVLESVKKLSQCSICIGNPDDKFICLHRNSTSGYKDYSINECTIRSNTCHVLFIKARNDSVRCAPCNAYRSSLRKTVSDKEKIPENVDIRTVNRKYSSMTREELVSKCKAEKQHSQKVEKKLESLEATLKKLIDQQGEDLSSNDNNDMKAMTAEFGSTIKSQYEKDSFEYIFWNEQIKYNNSKSAKGMRWHPLIIKWCLQLQSSSSATYEKMRSSGFVHLPSSKTLYNYKHVLPNGSGFQPEVVKHLIKEAESKGMYSEEQKWRSHVGILQDEVKIKEDLVYSKSTGELIGYMDLGDTGNIFSEYEKMTSNGPNKLAQYMLVLMVRATTTDLKYPLAAFPTTGATSSQLYSILWEAIEILELDCQLQVLFITCDGATPNRKFFKLHKVEGEEDVYYAENPFAMDAEKRYIFFISDAPHLMKTTRNCFSNSDGHKNNRLLWKDGKEIKWSYIVKLFEDTVETNIYSRDYKLTRAHIDLTSFSKMKVKLAVQVLSSTVADSLEYMNADAHSETVTFIRHMNKFFDLMNVRSLTEGDRKINNDIQPYKLHDQNTTDRLQYLTEDFLGYFSQWKESVENRAGEFSKAQRATMMLSHQTVKGLRITTKSVVALIKYMLQAGTPYVLTHRFNQDPLEEFFGVCRHKCGGNNNPTVYDVNNTITVSRVIKSDMMKSVGGNITGSKVQKRKFATPQDLEPLPKRAQVQAQ